MKHFALGRLPVGQMNKTEAKYASVLEALKRNGNILWYRFEGIKLRLADNTFYSPDFFVMREDHVLECHEVKGFWMDDARVKIKVAADLYPFRFYAVKERTRKEGGGYQYEVFGSVASVASASNEASQTGQASHERGDNRPQRPA